MLFVRDYVTDQTILRKSEDRHDPCVSVILPTYSRRDSADRAIATVLAQSFADLELLVMDDGSQDGTYAMIERWRAQDPRVVHVRHERNSGLPGLRTNEGIELARGRYLAFQFDDDRWRPNALEVLVDNANRNPGAVTVGRAYFTGKVMEGVLPSVELNLINLYQQNRFANNGALFPRELVDRYGMYDCHIGMRRLCDWDLWLRYIRQVPFVVTEEIVSDVFMSKPGSIGLSVPWDLSLFYFIHHIPRNDLLTPARWRDYEVDGLRVGDVEFHKDLRRRLYEEHLVPYYLKFRHYFPGLEGFSATLPSRPRTVFYTKNSYDVSNDATLGVYDDLANRRGSYKAYFEPLEHVEPDWEGDADALLLVRTVEDPARKLMDQATAQGVPVGYYLDDDLLTFHEFGPQHRYLAPGTPFHENLTDLLTRSDAVWVTNPFIEESVRPLNPRTVPHNNAVPVDALPDTLRRRRSEEPLLIGYAGSGYRLDEFRSVWDALRRISHEYRDQVEFEFWGLDVSKLPSLEAKVRQVPFTFSYPHYLRRLKERGFDILLSPLLETPRPRLAKSQIKYHETAVAGALGIFSDVPQYERLPAGLTCLKAKNTADDWYRVLSQAIAMPPNEFDRMRERMIAHVREEFTDVAQIHKHEAAWRATEFHGKTRDRRYADGRPRVVYVLHSPIFGGGEIQLWRRLRLARQYGVEPIVVLPKAVETAEPAQQLRDALARENMQLEFIQYTCFTEPRTPQQFSSEPEREEVRAFLERSKPALVHTVTFIPSFGQICSELKIPHVASMYAVDESLVLLGARFEHCSINQSDSIRYMNGWSRLLRTEGYCSRELVPESIFAMGRRRHLERVGDDTLEESTNRRVRFALTGTLQERKSQLEAIEAVGRLTREGLDCQLEIYGYTHFFPKYTEQCEERVRQWGLGERVYFRGFTDNVASVLDKTDILLSLSTYESFPSSIKEAMAARVLVVATPVGGIPELIIDGVSGILCEDTTLEAMVGGIRRALRLDPATRERIIEQARRVARSEMHPDRVANDLFTMYTRAIDLTRGQTRENNGAASIPPRAARYGSGEYSTVVSTQYLPAGSEVTYRIAWGIAQGIQRVRHFFIPSSSRREQLLILTMRALGLWKRAGLRALTRRTREKVSQRVKDKPMSE